MNGSPDGETRPADRRAAARAALRPDAGGSEILRLARRDREAARGFLRGLSPEAQARAAAELRPELREEYLMLLDAPESVVPLLPEIDFPATIRSAGMSEAAWLLEIASPAQLRACVDVDCWSGAGLELPRLYEWLDALVEAGRPTLARALEELDLELLVLAFRGQVDLCIVGKEDEAPPGYFTEDGVVYLRPADPDDEALLARVKEITQPPFSEAQSRYWQLVYGVLFELPTECEEYARRWRSGRMLDLGFPDREQAMQAYRPLRPEQVESVASASPEPARGPGDGAVVERDDLPKQLDGTLVAQALRELDPRRAGDVLGYVLAVANSVAVADRLPLTESDSIPRALEKAVRGIDRGLRELASAQACAPAEVLDRTRPLDLFRVGATLDEALVPPPLTPRELGADQPADDGHSEPDADDLV